MNLPIPVVGVDPGPDWALNINACLTIVDAHDHTNGKGVQITPNGLNINSTLSVNGNDVIDFRTVRFAVQGSVTGAADLGCLYVSGEDLYFNDENGNVIRITQNGGVAGSPGSISNLTSPASASYVSGNQTFVWQFDVNQAANMDMQSIILRNATASSFGVTVSAPSLLSVDYNIILPTLPVVQSFVTIDSSGNMAAPWTVSSIADQVTISSTSNQLYVRNGDREHAWELNGEYASLTYPLENIDSIFFAPYNITITAVWIYNGTAGISGTTEFDLKVATSSGGSFTSILNTTGKIQYNAGNDIWTDSNSVIGSQTGVTKPVLSTSAISAGSAIRWDLIQSMSGSSTADARIRIYYKQS